MVNKNGKAATFMNLMLNCSNVMAQVLKAYMIVSKQQIVGQKVPFLVILCTVTGRPPDGWLADVMYAVLGLFLCLTLFSAKLHIMCASSHKTAPV